MATRFRLPSSGTPDLSPALRIAWTHTPGTIIRRPMATTAAGTGFATTAYVPDSADHLVAGTAHIAQFVSDPLTAQTIGAQTISITMLALEDHQNNNLFLHWTVYAVTPADSLVGTLVAARTDATEVGTSQQARTDSVTSTSVTVGDGDRLVFEVGLSGTPAATGGVQGHNGGIRFGDSGTDLAANDTATTDGNPWLDLATSTLTFQPKTSDVGAAFLDARGESTAARGATTAPTTRTRAHLAADGGPPRAGVADFTNVSGETLDPGLPADWRPDDIHVLWFSHNANGALASVSGWTQLYAQNNGAGQRVEVWWRRAVAGDTAPVLTLATNTVTTLRGAVIYGVRGCPTTDSPFDTTSILSNAAAATIAFTDVTTTQANDFVLALGAYANSPTDVTTMTGWTERTDAVQTFEPDALSDSPDVLANDTRILANGSSGAGMSLIYEWKAVTSAAAASATSVTVSGGTFSNAVSTGVVLALKTATPAPTGPTTTGAGVGRIGGRAEIAAGRGGVATANPRVPARAATAVTHGGVATTTLRASTRGAATAVAATIPQTTGAAVLRAPARGASAATRSVQGVGAGRLAGRAATLASRAVTATVAAALLKSRAATVTTHGAASVGGAWLRSRAAISAGRATTGVGTSRVRAFGLTSTVGATLDPGRFWVRGGILAVGVRGAIGVAVPSAYPRGVEVATHGGVGVAHLRGLATLVGVAMTHEGSGVLWTSGRILAVATRQSGAASGIVSARPALAVASQRGALALAALRSGALVVAPSGIADRQAAQITLMAQAGLVGLAGPRAAFGEAGGFRARADVVLGIVRVGHTQPVLVMARATSLVTGFKKLSPRVPMQELTPLDLGTGYRGDTLILPVWVAMTREGEPYNLEDGTLYFTAKEDLILSDTAPRVIQCSSEDGGIAIFDPPSSGQYRVRIDAGETQGLYGDTVFTFDVQLSTDDANIYTIRRGLLTVVRDVTRTPA